MSTQMIRVEPYAFTLTSGLIGEANREPDYCRHVLHPKPPQWMLGSADTVRKAMDQYMKTPAKYRHKNGKIHTRKRGPNHRCLVAGFTSWPVPIQQLRGSSSAMATLREWCLKCRSWLISEFGENLKGIVVHLDEEYFHMHFFVVGDANLLHPGLKQEFVDGARLLSGEQRHERHVAGLKAFLSSYHNDIGVHFGLSRKSEKPTGRRIKNRDLAVRLANLEKRVEGLKNAELLEEFHRLQAAATFVPFSGSRP